MREPLVQVASTAMKEPLLALAVRKKPLVQAALTTRSLQA